MGQTDLFGYTYGAVLVVGGLVGFLKAGSLPSLIAGVASGAIILIGANLVSQNSKNVFVILTISTLLMIFMGDRFAKSGKFMPSGLVSLLSLISFVRYGLRLTNLHDE